MSTTVHVQHVHVHVRSYTGTTEHLLVRTAVFIIQLTGLLTKDKRDDTEGGKRYNRCGVQTATSNVFVNKTAVSDIVQTED